MRQCVVAGTTTEVAEHQVIQQHSTEATELVANGALEFTLSHANDSRD